MTPQELAAVFQAGAEAVSGIGMLREEELPSELYGPAAVRRALEAMAAKAGDTGGKTATYQDPVITWRPEGRPDAIPRTVPPPGEFTVTRSEIEIRPQRALVHIWYAAVPAEPACYRSAIGALVHGPGCSCPVT